MPFIGNGDIKTGISGRELTKSMLKPQLNYNFADTGLHQSF
jgi:hypothetical protein